MDEQKSYTKVAVHTWYLAFRGGLPKLPGKGFSLTRWHKPEVLPYLDLYRKVGAPWGWTGRLLMPETELYTLLSSEENEVWLFLKEGEMLGFFEIRREKGNQSELVYLGLLPGFIGKGYGRTLIDAAVAIAGSYGEKVWLHTCDRDHPGALQSYLNAGFVVEKEQTDHEFYPE